MEDEKTANNAVALLKTKKIRRIIVLLRYRSKIETVISKLMEGKVYAKENWNLNNCNADSDDVIIWH